MVDTMYVMNETPRYQGELNVKSVFEQLANELANEIFIADGGVDDFDKMSRTELYAIAVREVPIHLADLVSIQAMKLQENSNV